MIFHIIPFKDKGHLWINERTIRRSYYFKHTTSALKREALCPKKPLSPSELGGEEVGIREYEIWRVLVRQFA